ncbi:xylan glycosyltransferase MUCI21-like [Rutidosis leptorrhynchoides]|uniref:xylan glycosyltransferase MUCI21-like n=1 Tax=Rutidosis leptorrhynchoides TaxID=125765 RepID=UPI003A9A465A
MVHYQRYIQLRKGVTIAAAFVDEEDACVHMSGCNKRSKPKLLFFLLFCTLLSSCLILSPHLFPFPKSTVSLLYPSDGQKVHHSKINACSSVTNGTICCDRSSIRSDVCIIKGDIRTNSQSFSVFVYNSDNRVSKGKILKQEKIRPYTRKWEPLTMATIDELTLIALNSNRSEIENRHKCDVKHDVPAVFFSTGGYTGNVYHEFNDGLIPLYITSQKYNKKVVFVILEYHDWWITKYANILKHLSDFEPVDFSGDKRTHCFSESVVGLKIHDELTVDSSLMEGSKTIKDFRDILDKGYAPRIQGLILEENAKSGNNLIKLVGASDKPKLVIISRNGSRAILNENVLVKMASKIGYDVTVLKPQRTSELAKIYRELNSSDVMVGVHGAAMTHFLFMKPGSVFIQVVPLGTTWAAETYYGEPAKKLGLRYIGYEILPRESSLYDEYESNDPVLRDPNSVNDRGWEFTKKIYLDRQKVRLNLGRFRKRLVRSYIYTMAKRNGVVRSQ